MTIEAAYAALIEANPIRDAEAYAEHRLASAVFLTATRERTETMTTQKTEEVTKSSKQRKWQPLAAVAAFVVVLALGAAALLTLNDGTDAATVPAPPFESPEEAVEAYYNVLERGDADAYAALFAAGASDAIFNGAGIASDAKISARVEASGLNTYSVEECVAETDRRTKCTVTLSAPWHVPIWGDGATTGLRLVVILTIDEAGWISRVTNPNQVFVIDNRGLIDDVRDAAWEAWLTESDLGLWEEWNHQIWGSDELKRSAGEILRDYVAAAEEFAAEYDG